MANKRRRTPPACLVRRVGGGVAAVLAALMIVVTPGPVSAAVVPVVAAGPTQSSLNDQLESVVEDYDRVNGLLEVDQAKAAILDAKVRQLNRQVTRAQAQLQPVVRRAYEIGSVSTLRLLIDSDTTTTLANQLALSEAYAHQQREQIATLTATRKKDAAAKKALATTIKTLTARKTDLATKKRTILAQIATLQQLRHNLPPGELDSPDPLQPVACPYTKATGAAATAVRVACAQIGKPYVWAAAGPTTFDCSGLMVYAWGKAGKKLRHFTGWQWQDGTPITASQLRPGDLVFFYPPTRHHVGMYVGGGWMVNAPHTGDVVRMARINQLPIAGYRRP